MTKTKYQLLPPEIGQFIGSSVTSDPTNVINVVETQDQPKVQRKKLSSTTKTYIALGAIVLASTIPFIVSRSQASLESRADSAPKAASIRNQLAMPYVAAEGSPVYHLRRCGSLSLINVSNLKPYATTNEAIAAGLKPCLKCLGHSERQNNSWYSRRY